MSDSLKQKATKGIIWSALERFSVQGVQFFIMIIMARLLTPKDYGLLGMLGVFLAVAQSLIDSGFTQALIRKQNRTEVDNSTVFYFNVVVSIILYLLLYIVAPYVAQFYNAPELCIIMRVTCISIIINSLSIIQRVILTIKIDFKTQAKVSFIATLLSGIIGISLAYSGYGVWALVYQSLLIAVLNSFLLWVISKWRPIFAYSWKSFIELFSFGSKLLASGLLDTIYKNIYPIIIGKVFSASDLGYYTRAQNFSDFPSSNSTSILQRVTYPILCNIQNNDEQLRNVYRRFLKLSAYIIFPLMTGLAAVSHPFIIFVIGDKWAFCAKLLQIICFSMMWYPIHAINLNLLQVKGRSDLFLRLEIIKKIMVTAVIIMSIPFGVIGMCYGGIITSILCLFINTYYTGKLINIGFQMQMRDILPTLILSIFMFIIVLGIVNLVSNTLLQLIMGVFIGFTCYLGISYLCKFEELQELFSILRNKKM